jgi:hypothetical protein
MVFVMSSQREREAREGLAYGLNHDDFLALSRVVSALSANRTAFGLSVTEQQSLV